MQYCKDCKHVQVESYAGGTVSYFCKMTVEDRGRCGVTGVMRRTEMKRCHAVRMGLPTCDNYEEQAGVTFWKKVKTLWSKNK